MSKETIQKRKNRRKLFFFFFKSGLIQYRKTMLEIEFGNLIQDSVFLLFTGTKSVLGIIPGSNDFLF